MCTLPTPIPHAALPVTMETRSRDVHPETRKGPNTAPVLAFHKSAGHDWQTVWKDPTRYRRK